MANEEKELDSHRSKAFRDRPGQQRFKDSSISFQERLRMLETKVNAYLGFNSDPFYWTQESATCVRSSKLNEYCPGPGTCDLGLVMPVCLDNFRYNDCIMYDFGIRTQPEFGVILSKPPFNCQVFAFDPSPITKAWYLNNTELKDNENYHMFLYGGGAADETITLREYNWGQVSIYSYPTVVVANPRNCTDGACRFKRFPEQQLHPLPVRSVTSIMKEFGHSRIDLLKIDVEGSEYRMLEGLIDSGMCNVIQQMTLEWHHYDYDARYGPGSVPHLNVFTKLLKEKCGLSLFYICHPTGWPANDELFLDMKLDIKYNIASFMQVEEGKV
jgi:FkbM family methyltransferase